MNTLQENIQELELHQKLMELEELLQQTKQELAQTNKQNKELENILLKSSTTKKSNIITIKGATKIDFVNINDIVFCMADEVYTHVQLINEKTIVVAKALSTFEQMLEKYSFFRVSKSCLINTEHIITFYKDKNQVLLKGNIVLDVARRRRIEFLKTI